MKLSLFGVNVPRNRKYSSFRDEWAILWTMLVSSVELLMWNYYTDIRRMWQRKSNTVDCNKTTRIGYNKKGTKQMFHSLVFILHDVMICLAYCFLQFLCQRTEAAHTQYPNVNDKVITGCHGCPSFGVLQGEEGLSHIYTSLTMDSPLKRYNGTKDTRKHS